MLCNVLLLAILNPETIVDHLRISCGCGFGCGYEGFMLTLRSLCTRTSPVAISAVNMVFHYL